MRAGSRDTAIGTPSRPKAACTDARLATPESTKNAADVVNRHPDRFLFGTDEVAPPNQEKCLKVYNQYEPFWKLLSQEASEKVRKKNYERIFDEARRKVRSWEAAQRKPQSSRMTN